MMVYLVQRGDCDRFRLCADLDPAYAEAFDRAALAGVEACALACAVSEAEIVAAQTIPILAHRDA